MKTRWSNFGRSLGVLAFAAATVYGGLAALGGMAATDGSALAQQVPTLSPPSGAGRTVPRPTDNALSNALGKNSDSDVWRDVRVGVRGGVPIPDLSAGVLVQSEGDNWRNLRNGPVVTYGWWLLAVTVALIALFFAIRGRIRIDAGPSGERIERFNTFERAVHWMTAGSFVVLALTGLNVLYGRYLFAMGPAGDAGNFPALHEAFAAVAYYGKFVHNYIGFSFAVGVVLMIVMWIKHNLPDRYDIAWVLKGGGMFGKGVHPSARKFNAGQKMIFWVVVIAGVSITWSGFVLIFPYQFSPFAATFAIANVFGFNLPTEFTPLQEMQLTQMWHSVVALIFIAVIIAHIYIGTLGMEGAWDAMGTGLVDENWAREHHDIWVAELKGDASPGGGDGGGEAQQPAE